MKQRFLLLFFSIAFISLKAQDVPETQTPLITKITASWCSNCGSWGWDLFEGLVEDNTDNAIMIAAHDSGDLTTPVGVAFSNNFTAIGQPKFFLNNEDQRATRSNMPAKRTEIKGLIADMNAETPVANTGMIATMANGKIEVQSKTKFFQAAQGEYFLSLYVLEDDVLNMQASRGMAMHKRVMRTGFTSEVFGSRLTMMTMLGSGMEFSNTHSVDVNPSWNTDKLTVVAMIWKKESNVYQFVNAHSTNDFSGASSSLTDIFSEVSGFEVFPTIVNETATVKISLDESINDVQLNIFDLTGKKTGTIFNGNLNEGTRTFEINRNNFNAGGIYFLTLEAGGKRLSQKLIVQ